MNIYLPDKCGVSGPEVGARSLTFPVPSLVVFDGVHTPHHGMREGAAW